MSQSVHRRFLRASNVGWMLFALLRPASAAAQSAEIYPWQNIQQVVDNYPAGTTFYLKAGVHRMQTITPRSGDRFVGEPGSVLSGARQLTEFSQSGAYWVATGQTQEGPRPEATCRAGFPRCAHPDNLFIDGVPLRHVDSLGAVSPGTFFFDYTGDRIYFMDDPTNRTVEASVIPAAFGGYATDVLISNLVIEKYATPVGQAAVPVSTRGTLESSEVRLNHYAGVGTGNGSVVRHTYIHHNGSFGLIGAGDNTVIESNEIAYNNFAGFDPYWGAGGSKWVLHLRSGRPRQLLPSQCRSWTVDRHREHLHALREQYGGGQRARRYLPRAQLRRHDPQQHRAPQRDHQTHSRSGRPAPASRSSTPRTSRSTGTLLEDNWQGITGLDDHRGSGPYGPYALKNLNVHDNIIVSRITEPGGGRTGIIDMDLSTALRLGQQPVPAKSVCARRSDRRVFHVVR